MDDQRASCPFCGVIRGDTPADIVWQDDQAVAFLDRSPLFHGHTLVVPRRHAVTLLDLRPDELGDFFGTVQQVAAAMLDAIGVPGTFVAMNNVVSQSVAHLHVHVVPRRKGDGLRGFFWPRQKYAEGQAELFAQRLRAVLEGSDTSDR